MGIHLHIVKQDGETTQDALWWDSLRHAYDREFVYWHSRGRTIEDSSPQDVTWGDVPTSYWRPSDFAASRAWIDATIPEEGRARFSEALDRMEADPALWFTVSY